mmetsp:Transcript_51087/g.119598  ORF Transcript_51087/g.119598 Transcript_51087/m.119598 type:complete len:242 (+) Transcript_51087:60-785(+)
MGVRDCLCCPCYCCYSWAGSVPYLSLAAVATSLTMSSVAFRQLPSLAEGADALGFNGTEMWWKQLRLPMATTTIADCMALLLAVLSCSKVQEHFRAERRSCCFPIVQLLTSKIVQAMVFKLLISVWVMHFAAALATAAALPGYGAFITGCDVVRRPVLQQLAQVLQLFGLTSRSANVNRFCSHSSELYANCLMLFAAVVLNVIAQTALLVTTSMNSQRLWLQPKLDPSQKALLADEPAKDV